LVLKGLRSVALLGTCAVVVWQLVSLGQIQPHQGWGFLVLALAGLAVGLMLRFLLRDSARRLRRHYDVFIPLGLYIPAEALLGYLAAIPALATLLTPNWSVRILGLTLSLSLIFVLELVLGIIYAGWVTSLILQAVIVDSSLREGLAASGSLAEQGGYLPQDQVEPLRAIADIRRWFLRVLGAELFGWGVWFLGMVVALALAMAFGGLALILIAVFSLVWSLASAALLPVVVAEAGVFNGRGEPAERRSFRAALAQGLRLSWKGKGRWWLPVVLQMILLGSVTYFDISYSSSPSPGSFTTTTKTSFQANGFWTGGYEDSCRWHTDLMKVVEAEPLPLVTTLLGLLFAVLAIAIKFRIVTDIVGPGRSPSPPADV
jgi:hypothetical protein